MFSIQFASLKTMFIIGDKHFGRKRLTNAASLVKFCRISKFDHRIQLILSVLKLIELG